MSGGRPNVSSAYATAAPRRRAVARSAATVPRQRDAFSPKRGRVLVGHDDLGAFLRQEVGDGLADAVGAGDDERRFPVS